tara:strand:- start:3000 stop:3722 length:723 start_codon:yes stop_codon:yes gene_type:complete
MKTVKDFRDAGLVFVIGDMFNDLSSITPVDTCTIRAFVWRENTGEKPSFKGNIDIITSGESAYTGPSTSFRWDASDSKHSIIKWRPTLIQSRTPEKFNVKCGARPISYTRKEELHPDFIAALVKLKIKEPVFTQEMSDNGEMPKVGMIFSTEAGEYIAEYTNETSVCFTDENGFLVAINRGYAKPLPAPIELVDGAAYMFSFEDSEGTGLYVEDEHCLYMVGCQYSVENCTNIRPLTLSK